MALTGHNTVQLACCTSAWQLHVHLLCCLVLPVRSATSPVRHGLRSMDCLAFEAALLASGSPVCTSFLTINLLCPCTSSLESVNAVRRMLRLRGLGYRLRRQIERKRETLAKLEINAKVKEDLKTVALGTSKINYLDPRITVAWCKQHEVPIEKIFNKSLLSKFHWSMEIEPEFRF